MKTPDIYRAELLRGLYTRVAHKLELGKSGRAHVSRVVRGERRSPRVEASLREELRRIDRAVQKYEKTYRSAKERKLAA